MVPQFVGLYTLHNNLRTTIFYSIKQHIYELSLPFLKVSILSTPSYEQLTSREKKLFNVDSIPPILQICHPVRI